MIAIDQYDLKNFYVDLGKLGIILSDLQVEQFLLYYEMLVEKNKVMNLTAITEFDEVLKKHFIDSLSLVKACNLSEKKSEVSLMDIGTGAGFPGIPLKIAFPHLKITLMDSLHKRVEFLKEVIVNLGLSEIDALHGRAEDYAKPDQLREKFDLCISRAVAHLSVLSEYCLPYVKVGGNFVSYKSAEVEEEVQQAKKAIHVLGGKVVNVQKFTLPGTEVSRSLVQIEKQKKTPKGYPRKSGTPSKSPIH